ncbi:uncharacterized protein LOC108112104 [Drosophila eugracilis]|uniref:uncharacterized protein LOC108112104 n=1 Tax=Drosophila eugracilis TaxID=29029 RepID=UPI001BDA6E1B|nr:uncharacterized protein LOC108112104 [Drosophila eugracilis]
MAKFSSVFVEISTIEDEWKATFSRRFPGECTFDRRGKNSCYLSTIKYEKSSQRAVFVQVHSLVEFTNIKCEVVDPEFCNFEYCYLKSVNRTYKYCTLKVNLLKIPVTKIKVNAGIYKFANGHKSYLYNFTVDACKFLRNPTSNPLAGYIYDYFKDNSNMNHTCPYDHDLEVDKITTQFFNHRMTNVVPFAEGKYLFQMNWIAYDIMRAVFKVHFLVEFTNSKIESIDTNFSGFEYCLLKSVN